MTVDTKTMRDLVAASPGDRVEMQKTDFASLLDHLERGQSAERTLKRMRGVLADDQDALAA